MAKETFIQAFTSAAGPFISVGGAYSIELGTQSDGKTVLKVDQRAGVVSSSGVISRYERTTEFPIYFVLSDADDDDTLTTELNDITEAIEEA